MKHLIACTILFISTTMVSGQNLRESVETPTRAIRKDVPLTNSIRQAIKAGTRDFSGTPGPNYWQLKTDYTIKAKLNQRSQEIYGAETIVLHNNSHDELNYIVLKLDHNIFRAKVQRGSSVPAEITEGMVITKIIIDDQEVDLTLVPRPRRRGVTYEPRLEALYLDQTVVKINLVTPIKAKSQAIIKIEWHTKLPGGPNGKGHRMTQRWDNTLFQPTQWYPRIAKYDDLRGWETSPYLGPAEFHNNFGKFDVRLNVPGGWIVSGTGVLQNPQEVLTTKAQAQLAKVLDSNDEITIVGEDERGPGKSTLEGKRLEWHFIADNVNDFAWATADRYIWKATRATIPGKGAIPIHMLFLPDRASLFAGAGEITRHALEFYSELWAPYPFPQLTLQDGPSAGMEYPMVINSNKWAADHETAHQWWPMMVGTNETRYGWMDEGFNQYMNVLSNADRAGSEPNFNGRGQSYGRTSGSEDEATLMWKANFAGEGYGYQTYLKTPLMLSMLGGIVGDKAVQKAMSEYTKVWKFKHPSPWDYMFFMNNALDQNLEWFWYYWLFTTESVEGSIQDVSKKGNITTVTVHQGGQMPSPIVLKVEFVKPGAVANMPNAKMLDDQTALVTYPVDVWFNGNKNFKAALDFSGKKISKITLDPHGRFPDKNTGDNIWPRSE
jgi:Peptidase family M1 domain